MPHVLQYKRSTGAAVAAKELSGRDMINGEFTFVLEKVGNSPLNKEDGTQYTAAELTATNQTLIERTPHNLREYLMVTKSLEPTEDTKRAS